MKKTASFLKRVFSVMTIAVLLSQQIMPILVFAQATDNVDNVPVTETLAPTEYTTESITETPSPTRTINKTDNNVINIPKVEFKLDLDDPLVHTTPKLKSVDLVGKLQKFSNITIENVYVYALNSDVSIKFTKLPVETDLSFTIEEVSVDLDGKTLTGYDIKSDMVDGEFSYELVLPNTVGQKAEVQFSEDGATFNDVPNEKLTLDTVAVNADHFTIFVVINPNIIIGNGNTDLENNVIVYPDATAPTITDFNIQRSGGWNNGLIIDQKAHYDSTNTYPIIGNTVNLGANFQDAEGNLVTTSLGVHAAWFPGGTSNWAGIPTGNYQFTWDTLTDARYNYTTSATDTADGVRRVLFHAQDGISPTIFNYVNEEYSVIVDNTAPTVSYGALTPADGSIFRSSQGTIRIDGDFSDNYGLFDVRMGVSGVAWNCYWGPTDVYTNNTPANGNYSCDVNISSLADGTYYYAIQGLDKAGNTNNTTTRSFVIDNTAPSVPVKGTPNGTSIPTNNFDFNWDNSTDSSLPITYLFHLSQNPTQVDGILTTGLWTSSILPSNTIHSSGAPDGTWYWQVQAIDSVGNRSAWSQIWSVTLDTVAPTIVFDGFKDQINSTYDGSATTKPCGSFNSTGFISWEWTLSNLENNLVNYQYTILSGPTAVGLSMPTQNTHVNGAIPVEGSYVVSVTGTDSAGNVGNTIECSVTFDNTPPTTPLNLGFSNPVLSCGAYTNIGSNTVNWDDSTDIVGVTGYDYYIEYPLLPTGTGRGVWGTTRTISEYTGTFNPGLHQIKVRAFDAAGNKSEWTQLCDINYDIQGPVIDTIPDQSYDEGSYINNLEILNDKGITDDQKLDRFFLNVDYSPFTDNLSENLMSTSFDISGINGDGMGGTLNELIDYELGMSNFDFTDLDGVLPIDTSIIPEGVYTFTYWAYDMAGNRSTCNGDLEPTMIPSSNSLQGFVENTDCSFSITINNVNPTVTLDANQTIDEGQTASFTGSFTDPSYLVDSLFYYFDSGINTSSLNSKVLGIFPQNIETLLVSEGSMPNYPDDSNWIASMNYGDGSDILIIEPFMIPGTVTIPDHLYTNNGVYTATLTVCEGTETHNTEFYGLLETTLVSGEGNCDSKTVLVTVNNLAPTVSISSNPGNNVAYGTDVTLTAAGLGGNAPLTYLWSGACSGTSQTFTLPASVGTRSCTVTVTDVDGDIASADLAVTVNPMVVTGGTTTTTTTTGQVAGTSTTITTTPSPSPTPTGKIAGEDTTGILGLLDQKCTTKYDASGYAFIDANNNGSKDASEVVAANVEVIIYLENVLQEDGSKKNIDILTIKTNSEGLWKANICAGSYKLKVNPNTLPSNTKLVKDSIDLTVKSDQTNENINLALVDNASGFNWWWLLVLAVLAGIFVLVYKASKSKDDLSVN